MGKRSAAALGGKRERERQHFSWLPAVEGFLCELGQNEMESSYIYSLCKGLVQIAHLYICESYKTMNTTNMESFCVTKKRPTRSEKTKPDKPLADKVPLGKLFCTTLNGHHKHQNNNPEVL